MKGWTMIDKEKCLEVPWEIICPICHQYATAIASKGVLGNKEAICVDCLKKQLEEQICEEEGWLDEE